MANEVHVTKRADGAWAVKRQGAARSASVHKTQAEAAAAGRRLALKSGGAEVVIHRADGRIRDRDSVGAAQIDAAKHGLESVLRAAADRRSGGRAGPPATSRAPRTEGPRTTLRVPNVLVEVVDRFASELNVSRNDALLRLATRGARQYEQERRIAQRREQRWAAVVPGIVDFERADFPSPDEARSALFAEEDEPTTSR